MRLLMTAIVFAGLGVQLTAAGYTETKTGLILPAKLGPLECQGEFKYPNPEAGVRFRYIKPNDPSLRFDIFIYDSGSEPENMRKELKEQFQSAIDAVRQLNKKGGYALAEFGAVNHKLELGGHDFLWTELDIATRKSDGGNFNQDSFIYLGVVGDAFLKIRVSYPADSKPDAKAAQTALAELAKILEQVKK